jgi:hypothetical protein
MKNENVAQSNEIKVKFTEQWVLVEYFSPLIDINLNSLSGL